jgi:P-type Cu2+ transporter
VSVRTGVSVSQAVQMAAALAAHSLHPASKTLAATARLPRYAAPAWDSDGVSETAGQGVAGRATPVPALGEGSRALRLGSAEFCGLAPQASATLQVHLSDPQGWLATFEVREELRPQALQTVASLRQAGVQVQLLSGDGADSVARLAAEAGIYQARGNCSPADKLAALRALQAQGHKVLMVGDGLNDGPVLAGAHVSIAFGQAVPLAQAQSDFVVLGEQLMAVAYAVRLARKTMAVVRQNLWWALLYNAACVPLAVLGWLPAWAAGLGMACSSLVVVANALRLSGRAPMHKGI